jgi:hypothetical protein
MSSSPVNTDAATTAEAWLTSSSLNLNFVVFLGLCFFASFNFLLTALTAKTVVRNEF